jgi:hypothetical protein
MRAQLSKPPFSAFKTFKLLDTINLRVDGTTANKTTLPSGQTLVLTLRERLLSPKNRVRLRMHLVLSKPAAKRRLLSTRFTIYDGGTIFFAVARHQGGTMVIGITCRSQ